MQCEPVWKCSQREKHVQPWAWLGSCWLTAALSMCLRRRRRGNVNTRNTAAARFSRLSQQWLRVNIISDEVKVKHYFSLCFLFMCMEGLGVCCQCFCISKLLWRDIDIFGSFALFSQNLPWQQPLTPCYDLGIHLALSHILKQPLNPLGWC